MHEPLVTVICLCYNQERFVKQAIESVIQQSYKNIQIIVWDDASLDNSQTVIRALEVVYPQLQVTLSAHNEGNCRAFNRAYALARGEFIIDFSTDDVMHPRRIERQVKFFTQQNNRTGVVFTDATYIDEQDRVVRHHFEHLLSHRLITRIATGSVFREVLTRFYIASPTMMIRRNVLDQLGGYDEELAYEDFDLWVRSARDFNYAFLDERLTLIRKSSKAMSTSFYRIGDKQLLSTYHVCLKALSLCRDDADRAALSQRVRYELRHSALSGNFHEGRLFWQLLNSMNARNAGARFWNIVNILRLPLAPLLRIYQRVRYENWVNRL
jgi:glycosyltransferase involved in cell wall biosynthesis